MKIGELNLYCGDCPIIDYCNDYEDTPPCIQPRFENVNVDIFLELADSAAGKTKDEMIDNIYERLQLHIRENHTN
jgi:hypothetical protein